MASLFTKILQGEIPSQIIYQDEHCFAISDIQPQAPHHYLIIPKKEIVSVADSESQDQAALGQLLLAAKKIAQDKGFSERGYRLVINTNSDGGQTVPHLHVHLLAGRKLTWPPG